MSFRGSNLLRRGGSFHELSNNRKRIPGQDEIFREGYVFRRVTVARIPVWNRNFCILQQGELSFHASWDAIRDDSTPLLACRITANTQVSLVESKKGYYFNVSNPDWEHPIHLFVDSQVQLRAWMFMIELEMQRANGNDVSPPSIRARFFEGLLFKTPPEADRWEERWFELSTEGELSYWQSHGSGKRGVIDLETCKIIPNQTEAKGICTPFIFQIHAFVKEVDGANYRKRVYNLSAPTQSDYLNWLKALKVWVGVKRPPLPGSLPDESV